MGMKPRKTRKDLENTLTELEEGASALLGAVCFALKHLRAPGAGLYMDSKTGICKPWQDKFMDAADKVGYKIDRKKYWADR